MKRTSPGESKLLKLKEIGQFPGDPVKIEGAQIHSVVVRVPIPLGLSTVSLIPLPRFNHTRNTTPLLTPSPSIVLLSQSSA